MVHHQAVSQATKVLSTCNACHVYQINMPNVYIFDLYFCSIHLFKWRIQYIRSCQFAVPVVFEIFPGGKKGSTQNCHSVPRAYEPRNKLFFKRIFVCVIEFNYQICIQHHFGRLTYFSICNRFGSRMQRASTAYTEQTERWAENESPRSRYRELCMYHSD